MMENAEHELEFFAAGEDAQFDNDDCDARSDVSFSSSGSSLPEVSPQVSPKTYMARLEHSLMTTPLEWPPVASMSSSSTAPSRTFEICPGEADEDAFDLCEDTAHAVVGPAPNIDAEVVKWTSNIRPPNSIDVEEVSVATKRKKPKDPVKEAMKRIQARQKKEAKEKKKARKREKKLAKKKRGAGADLESFLERTAERLNDGAIQALEEAARAHLAARAQQQKRVSGCDVNSFLVRTRGRVADKAAFTDAVAEADEAAKAAQAAAVAASQELEDFRKQTRERLARNMFAKLPQVQMGLVSADSLDDAAAHSSLFLRRKIAIVGAGPVGLWAAVLLAERYRKMENCPAMIRRPDAPDIHVIEYRPQESHCTRTDIRIALSTSTQSLLNSRTKSRSFSTGMPVADIESALLRRLRKIAPQASVTFGRPIHAPAELAVDEGFDCVMWAGGRRSLSDEVRQPLGCSQYSSEAERVLVFQFGKLQPGADVHADLSMPVQMAAKRSALRVLVRPGIEGVCAGWLWLFGLPEDAFAKHRPNDTAGIAEPPSSFVDALEAVLDEASPCASGLLAAAAALQQRLKPAECSARWVEAGYWSADRSVCDLGCLDKKASGSPLLVLGDALSGKPFFTGTTLNSHLKDVKELIDEIDWTHDGTVLSCNRFQAHERRYQSEIQRISHYERRNIAAAHVVPPRPASPPSTLSVASTPGKVTAKSSANELSPLSKTVSLPLLNPSSRSVVASPQGSTLSGRNVPSPIVGRKHSDQCGGACGYPPSGRIVAAVMDTPILA